MKNIKITNIELNEIKELALRNYLQKSLKSLNEDQFIARCYLTVIEGLLNNHGVNVKFEFEERKFIEPIE